MIDYLYDLFDFDRAGRNPTSFNSTMYNYLSAWIRGRFDAPFGFSDDLHGEYVASMSRGNTTSAFEYDWTLDGAPLFDNNIYNKWNTTIFSVFNSSVPFNYSMNPFAKWVGVRDT